MMATDFEWLQNKVSDLVNDLSRTQTLAELYLALCTNNSSEQKYIAQNLQLDAVFDCLNSSESEEIELACQVLRLLLCSLDSRVVVSQYGTALQRALGHPVTEVKEMAITELQRAANDSSLIPQLCQGDLLLTAVKCLSHDNLAVAKSAASLLVNLGKSSGGLRALYSEEILEGLRNAKQESDTVQFRVYEVVVDVAEHSAVGLQASVHSKLLPELLDEFKTADVLVQLTTLEVLTKLALCPHGFQYLEQQGVIQLLADKVAAAADDVAGSIVLPGLMKFFGHVAQSNPKEFFAQYPTMVASLFSSLDSPDLIMLGVAMETVGYIATTVEGKFMLQNLGDTMNSAMKTLAQRISNPPTELRVRAINTVANIIELKVADQDTQSLAITKAWFDALSPSPMETIMAVCRQPFMELKLAGLQVLHVLSEQVWGQEYINKFPGLIEFLLDRSVESIKSCKDAKFDVIQTIVESPTAASVFDSNTLLRLQDFIKEGPFYVHAQTEVAIEGAS